MLCPIIMVMKVPMEVIKVKVKAKEEVKGGAKEEVEGEVKEEVEGGVKER